MLNGLIIGGGIGGLAAAVALRQAGHEVTVYEQAPRLTEVGAGIAVWFNGLQALDALGVSPFLLPSISVSQGLLRASNGAILSSFSASEIPEMNGDMVRVFHRAELLESLHRALPEDAIRTGKRCISYRETPGGVEADFEDGTTVSGDYLIGADGIHSCIRAQLYGDRPPRYAGYTAWRAVVPFSDTFEPGETWGKGARFGAFPLINDRVYWFAVHTARPGERSPQGEKVFLMDRFRDWHTPIPALIDATDEADILRNDVIDRPPVKSWGRGRVTLLGDAAHAMTPNLGQGACQALEDAAMLRIVFSEASDVEQALRRYEKRRLKRANAYVRESYRFGRLAQARSAPIVWLRNTLVRKTPNVMRTQPIKKMMAWQV